MQGFVEWEETNRIIFKDGRTTGATHGTYSHIHSHVEISLDSNSSYDQPGTRITNEHVIVNPIESFCDTRDSGSWIISDRGEVMGLLWGAGCSGQGYFTPIGLVMEDIEKVTGMKVELYE